MKPFRTPLSFPARLLGRMRFLRRTPWAFSMRPGLSCLLASLTWSSAQAASPPGIARTWDEEILSAIRIDKPHPPVHARNLFSLSVVMYDAWASYDPVAVGYLYHSKHPSADVAACGLVSHEWTAAGSWPDRGGDSGNCESRWASSPSSPGPDNPLLPRLSTAV